MTPLDASRRLLEARYGTENTRLREELSGVRDHLETMKETMGDAIEAQSNQIEELTHANGTQEEEIKTLTDLLQRAALNLHGLQDRVRAQGDAAVRHGVAVRGLSRLAYRAG